VDPVSRRDGQGPGRPAPGRPMSALGAAATARDSASRLIGLIGSGIGGSLTPALHEREARAQGLCCLYRIIDLDVLGLAAADTPALLTAARRLGFDGLNITHPAKQIVLDHLDELSPDAAALQAVNTIVFEDGRAVGHNTDWSGFAQSFARGLAGVAADQVVLLGAGGAGAAVAHAALRSGTRVLTVVDLDGDRAASLAADLGRRFGPGRARAAGPGELASVLPGADGLIHATPTGMAAHPGLPLPAELLHPRLWVADVVYLPMDTELVRTARALGCVDAFRLFTGRSADAGRMLRHFRALVSAADPAESAAPAGPGGQLSSPPSFPGDLGASLD
jgi:shikimate dehydrogenase